MGEVNRYQSWDAAGLPDLLVFAPEKRLIGLELKTKTGGIQPSQTAMLADLDSMGFATAVCRSLDDVQAALVAAGVPFAMCL